MNHKHILFISPSFQPGKSGIGDYVRVVAEGLESLNCQSTFIGWNDQHLQHEVLLDGPALRFSPHYPLEKKISETKTFIQKTGVDAISLQYVGYGYHPQGLANELLRSMLALEFKGRWNIMVHELWPSVFRGCKFRRRIVGLLQRHSQLKLFRSLPEAVVHTQIEFYSVYLNRHGVTNSLLPLCSIIPRVAAKPWEVVIKNSPTNLEGKLPENKESHFIAATYGTIYPGCRLDIPLHVICEYCREVGKKPILLLCGNAADPSGVIPRIRSMYGAEVEVISTGFLHQDDLSALFPHVDLGLCTTPFEVLTKSSTAITFMEYERPLFASRIGCIPNAYSDSTSLPLGVYSSTDALAIGLREGLKNTQRPLSPMSVAKTLALSLDLISTQQEHNAYS